MRGTTIHYASPEWAELMRTHQLTLPDGRRVPSRFYGQRQTFLDRLHAAWLVFTGRADALVWLNQ